MTEADWLICTDPQAMLEFLRGKASERKLRLFAVACSRRIWDWIDVLGRAAVEVAEKYADGFASPEELRAARLACQGAGDQASWYAAATNPAIAARNAALSAQAGVANHPLIGSEDAELRAQAALLRDIFGALSFRQVSVDPTWVTPAVIQLAQTIYDKQIFNQIPILAGELEQAGCMNQDILSHCQELGPHVRGCWLLDLLLRKE